jgi:RNA-directed DNA polymerase
MKTQLKTTLSGDLAELVEKFLLLKNGQDVAIFLEVPYGQLLYLLYKKEDKDKYYAFDIPKKSAGVRHICKPAKGINILQQKIKPILVSLYRIKAPVHGFVEGRSIVTNSMNHTKNKYVLNIDIHNFYGSINYGRVRGLLLAKPFSLGVKAASLIAQLLCFNNQLPQGACTSPIVSNFIASSLDKKMVSLAKRYHLHYTRYADDITFSCGKRSFPKSMATFDGDNPHTGVTKVGKVLEDAVDSCGFKINHNKVRLQIKSIRQEVTGLTVNEFTNVKRKFVRQIRSMIYALDTKGKKYAELEYITKYAKKDPGIPLEKLDGSYFLKVIYGKLAFLQMVRGSGNSILINFAMKMGKLDDSPPKFIKKIMELNEMFDIFIGHASEDKKEVALPIYEACKANNLNAFIDEKYIDWGDSLTEKINNALAQSKYFLAVLSEHSVNKAWPLKELNSAIARDIAGDQKILPLIVGNPSKVLEKIPLISDKLYVEWKGNPKDIVEKIKTSAK